MEFMGISVGILALICALVLLFGARVARKILGFSFTVLILGSIGLAVVTWVPNPHAVLTQTSATPNAVSSAQPVMIFPPLPTGFVLEQVENKGELADKITVEGPDKRIFVFSGGTQKAAIESYMQSQYGAPGSPRAECWTKEPGPWCDYR